MSSIQVALGQTHGFVINENAKVFYGLWTVLSMISLVDFNLSLIKQWLKIVEQDFFNIEVLSEYGKLSSATNKTWIYLL